MFPDNIVQMTFSQYESEVIPHYVNVSVNNSNKFNNNSAFSLFENTTSKKILIIFLNKNKKYKQIWASY